MNTLNIAYYTMLRNFRDVKSMAQMILMPVLLILILGNALSSAFDIRSVGNTAVAYVDNDKGEISAQFENFLNMKDIKELLTVKKYNTNDEAVKALNDGTVRAVMTIDSGTSDKIKKGEKAEIKVSEEASGSVRGSIVKNVVDGFISGANAIQAEISIGGNPVGYSTKEMVNSIPLSAKGKIPGAMDYYAVTMLVLIMMYGSQYSIQGVGEDYLENMGKRLRSTPLSLASHFSGKILGTVCTVFIQSLLLILFTKVVYKANWGSNVVDIIFIAFTLSVFSVTLGLMVTMVLKDRRIASAVVSTIIPVMTFVSGGYARIVSDNPTYGAVKWLMPSNLGQTAFFNSIYGEFAGQTVSSVLILWIMIAVMGCIALMAGRRRLA